MQRDEATLLKDHGINPSAQRVAIAEYVLHTEAHPSADQVWTQVRERLPQVSRATVYNTLNLFVAKGLLRQFVLTEGNTVFDPKTEDHHHFIDDESGAIYDVPWEAVEIPHAPRLKGFTVREYQMVIRGKKKPGRRSG